MKETYTVHLEEIYMDGGVLYLLFNYLLCLFAIKYTFGYDVTSVETRARIVQ